MSLAHLLRSADARLRLDLVRPAAARLDGATAPAGRLPPSLAATALACGLRRGLARRDPKAAGTSPAEQAPARLETMAPELVPGAERALAQARGEGGRMEGVTPAVEAERALQLARLELLVRAGYVDARIGQAEAPEDVAEVAAMMAAIPWDELGAPTLAPPFFPGFAETLPDAEPDALVGGTLLVVSPSRVPRVDEDDLRALVARLVVARAEWGPEEASRRVRSLGVLLARHGRLWRTPIAPIVGHEAFPAVEAWILQRLDAIRAPSAAKDDRPARGAPIPKWVRKRFPPKAPMTSPEGKAEKKKGGQRPAGAPPSRPARREAPQHRDEPPSPRKARPDWRRGSPWRRDRGL